MLFTQVTDVAYVLLVEWFRGHGVEMMEAIERVGEMGAVEDAKQKEPDNDSSLTLLSAMIGGSDFKGALA